MIFLLSLAWLLSACPSAASSAPAESGIEIVTTMSVLADFAEQVGGDKVTVTTIVPVGGDPHTYEPTPSDAVLLSNADIVLDNGLGLSPWFEPLRTNVTGRLVVLTDGIAEQAKQDSGKLDPHMWMVPDLVNRGYITAIEAVLVEADPEWADEYEANADNYRRAIDDLDAWIDETVATIPPSQRKIVTSHDAYSYFADAYGLEVVGTILGVTTEEEPSAQTVAALIDNIRSEGVPAVFFETTINSALAERVAKDADVALADPLYGDSVGEPGSGADDYIGMMESNVRSIVAALGGQL